MPNGNEFDITFPIAPVPGDPGFIGPLNLPAEGRGSIPTPTTRTGGLFGGLLDPFSSIFGDRAEEVSQRLNQKAADKFVNVIGGLFEDKKITSVQGVGDSRAQMFQPVAGPAREQVIFSPFRDAPPVDGVGARPVGFGAGALAGTPLLIIGGVLVLALFMRK